MPLDFSKIDEWNTTPHPWTVWCERFASVRTWPEASELYQKAKADPEIGPWELKHLVSLGRAALQFVPRSLDR